MVTCEICGQDLIQSGNVEIYSCASSYHWIEENNKYLEFKHYSCHIKNGKINYKLFTIFPYRFELFYDDNKTKIYKSIVRAEIKNPGKETVYSTERQKVLELESIIDLPWNNKDQVLQKLKLYSIFS
jgi:hypothetical protein